MKYLLFNIWSSNEDYYADCDLGLVALTPRLLTTLNKRVHLVRKLKKEHGSDLWSLKWADWTPVFVSRHNAGLSDAEAEAIDDGRGFLLINRPEGHEFDGERLDMSWQVVDAEGVYWTAVPKHTDIHVETRELRAAAFKELRHEVSKVRR
jgi:hypothetical protein